MDQYPAVYSEEYIPEIKTNILLNSTIRAINVRNYTRTMSWSSRHRKAMQEYCLNPESETVLRKVEIRASSVGS